MPQNPDTIDVLGSQLQTNFNNISSLLSTIITGVTGEIEEQVKREVSKLFGSTNLEELIKSQAEAVIEKNIKDYNDRLKNGLDLMLNKVTSHITEQLDEKVRIAVKNSLSSMDLGNLVKVKVDDIIKNKINSYDFPPGSIKAESINWGKVKLSGSLIQGGVIENFNSTGIQDNSNKVQLTVIDDAVIVEDKVITNELHAQNVEVSDIVVRGNIEVTGNFISNENFNTQIKKSSKLVIDEYFNTDIDIKKNKILAEGRLLLNHDTLGPSVLYSNIRKLGLLQSLRVQGDAVFSETMHVGENKRIGINTDNPEGTLTIWDDDAEITIAKKSRRNMRIGSTRDSDITFGSNNKDQLVLKSSIVELLEPLRFMGLKISVMDKIPEHNGEPGEIVLIKNPKENQSMIYVCRGGNSWATVKLEIK
jgi:hypothetical protein